MTDVENLEKILEQIFSVKKKIRSKNNSNRCIAALNRFPLNMFAFNFMNRLDRLAKKFCADQNALLTICERVKNLGEASDSSWAGPYSELVALDFFSQFSNFFSLSYINQLKISEHKNSIAALNGKKEIIDIDLRLDLKDKKIFTDVKSFNCVHQIIFEGIFKSVEKFAEEKFGSTILIGAENRSGADYVEVKKSLAPKVREIQATLIQAVENRKKIVCYASGNLKFDFKINYSDELFTVNDYSPFAMAKAYRYKFLDYGNKLLENEYSMITMVKNPEFNSEIVDFGNFNNIFYRALSRRTFMELLRSQEPAAEFSSHYKTSKILVSEVSQKLAGIIFIDDNSARSKFYKSLYSVYIYLNPNYAPKKPLSIRSLEKNFRNEFEIQIKDFDDFKWDNY